MRKQEVLSILEDLPEELDPEQLMHELYLKARLERAEAAVRQGDLLSNDEVVKRSRQW